LALGNATAQLEKLYFAENKFAVGAQRQAVAEGLFRSTRSRRKHFANCVRYIRRNPAKARLHNGEFILYESELARSIE